MLANPAAVFAKTGESPPRAKLIKGSLLLREFYFGSPQAVAPKKHGNNTQRLEMRKMLVRGATAIALAAVSSSACADAAIAFDPLPASMPIGEPTQAFLRALEEKGVKVSVHPQDSASFDVSYTTDSRTYTGSITERKGKVAYYGFGLEPLRIYPATVAALLQRYGNPTVTVKKGETRNGDFRYIEFRWEIGEDAIELDQLPSSYFKEDGGTGEYVYHLSILPKCVFDFMCAKK